jgi:putative intracellular protease/amidase
MRQQALADEPTTSVAILMFDGVQIIDFAAPYEVFGQADFEVFTVSRDGGTVTTTMNLSVNPDYGFASAPDADVVLVPGGSVHEAMQDPATRTWLTARSERAEHVLSVCTGSYLLAGSGLLDGRSATTFHGALEDFARQFPQVRTVRDQRWVDNGRIITAAGLASGIDAALHVVARLQGVGRARTVALHLEYEWSPAQGFVRGQLADRYLRWPAQSLTLPDATRVERLLYFGDATRWQGTWRVSSPWQPARLLQELGTAFRAENDGNFVTETAAGLVVDYTAADGSAWRLTISAGSPDASGTYEVTQVLAPRGDTG